MTGWPNSTWLMSTKVVQNFKKSFQLSICMEKHPMDENYNIYVLSFLFGCKNFLLE